MKTSKYFKTIAFCVVMLAATLPGKAQVFPNTYINIDWQMAVPLGDDFADKTSGWGMNFEGGYYITPNAGVGLFMAFHTNNEYIDTQTLHLSATSQLTCDQQHMLFQMPFGAAFRYRFMPEKKFAPYAGIKVGAQYCKATSYYNVYSTGNEKWGVFVSPEIGVNIFPMGPNLFGFHMAFYRACFGRSCTAIFCPVWQRWRIHRTQETPNMYKSM